MNSRTSWIQRNLGGFENFLVDLRLLEMLDEFRVTPIIFSGSISFSVCAFLHQYQSLDFPWFDDIKPWQDAQILEQFEEFQLQVNEKIEDKAKFEEYIDELFDVVDGDDDEVEIEDFQMNERTFFACCKGYYRNLVNTNIQSDTSYFIYDVMSCRRRVTSLLTKVERKFSPKSWRTSFSSKLKCIPL